MTTRTPHKHAELIKAWADGAQIQLRSHQYWVDIPSPEWHPSYEYRIKPEPKPDYWRKCAIPRVSNTGYSTDRTDIIEITYSGETDEPIKVEICK